MNLSQYLQLNDSLKDNGLTLNEALNLPYQNSDKGLFQLFEKEEDELDISKSGVAATIFTRWGKLKNKLNSVAKKVQDNISSKILDKYMNDILQTESDMNSYIKSQLDNNKNKNEIVNQYRPRLQQIKKLQDQQLKVVYSAIDKFISASTTKMNEKIDNSKLTDKNKTNLKNYWLLLETQLKLNAYKKISNNLLNNAKNSIGEQNMDIYNSLTKESEINNRKSSMENEFKTKKEEVIKIENELKSEPEQKNKDFKYFESEIASIISEYKGKDSKKMKELLSNLYKDVQISTTLPEDDKKKLQDWFTKNSITEPTQTTTTSDENRGGKEDVSL